MGYNLELSGPDGGHATDLCTGGGLTGFFAWLDSLPPADYPSASAFSRDGRFRPTDALADELGRAFRATPPGDPDVRDVADRFLDLIGAGRPGESVAVVA